MQEEYGGYIITYVEHMNKFSAKIGSSDYSNSELSKVKKHIDDLDKKNYVRSIVLVKDGWNGSKYKTVTTSSEFLEGKDIQAWIIDDNKNRSKHSVKYLLKASKENEDKILQMTNIENEISLLRNKQSDIEKSLEAYQSQITEARSDTAEACANINQLKTAALAQ